MGGATFAQSREVFLELKNVTDFEKDWAPVNGWKSAQIVGEYLRGRPFDVDGNQLLMLDRQRSQIIAHGAPETWVAVARRV